MSLGDVCRLCLGTENLVWVFDKRFETGDNMKDVVYISTGVEISTKDIVSQKICQRCGEITIKMFKFRNSSLKNDMTLKAECKRNLPTTSNVNIPKPEVIITNENKLIQRNISEIRENMSRGLEDASVKMPTAHPSIHALHKIYPQFRLPSTCLNFNIAPVVSLPMNAVENYFKRQNLDFNMYSRLALKSSTKVARKRTSTVTRLAPTSSNKVAKKRTSTITKSKISSDVNSYTSESGSSSNSRLMDFKINRDNTTNKISIKITNKNSDECVLNKTGDLTLISNANIHNYSKTGSDLILENEAQEQIKRKFSEVEKTRNKENNKKPAFIESLGLQPIPSTSSECPVSIPNISVPLYICNICKSVQYSERNLRKHKNKHFRCQFCKRKFHTLENKKEHVDNLCIIKHSMKNVPDVVIEKIEYNEMIRSKYSDAFADFPPLKSDGNCKPENHITVKSVEKLTAPTVSPKTISEQPAPISPSHTSEIIEIISDDEDAPLPTTSNNTDVGFSADTLRSILLDPNSSRQSKAQSKANKDTLNLTSPNPQTSPSVPQIVVPPYENFFYNTVSIVRPDIRINGNCILDNIDVKWSDIKLLKELILNYSSLQLSLDQCTQTDMPTNSSISTSNQADVGPTVTELKNLIWQMYTYKIPVIIKNGPFNVSYSYEAEEKRPVNKQCLWNDLTPIDIKTNTVNVLGPMNLNKQISVGGSEKQGSDKNAWANNNYLLILTSTPSYNSSCTISVPSMVTATTQSCTSVNGVSHAYSVLPSTSVHNTHAQSLIPVNVSTNGSFTLPSTVVTMNNCTSNVVQTPTFTTTMNSLVVSSSNPTPQPQPLPNNLMTVGKIRVKNVWELS